MLKIPPRKELLNESDEWHSLIIGLCEIINPIRPKIPMSYEYRATVQKEYHYYQSGRAMPVIIFALALLHFLIHNFT